jgi:hypothetical protein
MLSPAAAMYSASIAAAVPASATAHRARMDFGTFRTTSVPLMSTRARSPGERRRPQSAAVEVEGSLRRVPEK